jgi:hypothetical protein
MKFETNSLLIFLAYFWPAAACSKGGGGPKEGVKNQQ